MALTVTLLHLDKIEGRREKQDSDSETCKTQVMRRKADFCTVWVSTPSENT